jgi:MbtH protein
MANPFDDENGFFHVLVNEEGQHSIWPASIDVPNGWTVIFPSSSRSGCLQFVDDHWTDMRPNSLIRKSK